MQRIVSQPRENWESKVAASGVSWYNQDGTYWDETAHYLLNNKEVDDIQKATQELTKISFAAIELVLRNSELKEKYFNRMGISPEFARKIEQSWNEDYPTLYGRFDLAYDEYGSIVMLEFNADTPTSLVEASVAQWAWLTEVFPSPKDQHQFNTIHEALLEQFQYFRNKLGIQRMHFSAHGDSQEDVHTTLYLMDVASQANIQTKYINLHELGSAEGYPRLFDNELEEISYLFKLYPWEVMIDEPFGKYLMSHNATVLVEPAWKAMLTTKLLLPLLWSLFPGHSNLLPSYYQEDKDLMTVFCRDGFVTKPIYSREGQNVSIYGADGELVTSTPGQYSELPYVLQNRVKLPEFVKNDGSKVHSVIGSWVVGEDSVGLGIRESGSLITTNTSSFVPHRVG